VTAPTVRCPQCGKFVAYRLDNPARPFCSPRCKLIDLGAWAEERYAIPGVAEQSLESQVGDATNAEGSPYAPKPRPADG
jgi:endogenous inhibitor of DNA gyrase (YacG/DUF329 family)